MAKIIAAIGNKLIKVGEKIGLYPSCCCNDNPTTYNQKIAGPPDDYCPEGVYINGPTIAWVWNAGLGGWLLAPPETIETANQKCQGFYDANELLGGGASPPNLSGAFDGEEITVPSCVCGS